MNTFPPATAAAAAVEEDGVCSWDMVDAIREEDDGLEVLTSLLDSGASECVNVCCVE